METPIITEYGHQYVYSDVLHYFLYVPEKMKIAMRGSGHNVVGATDYYMRKFNNFKSGIGQDADGLMRIFRLAELYLNFAEAAYQAVGPDGQVVSKVGAEALSARDAVNRRNFQCKIQSKNNG